MVSPLMRMVLSILGLVLLVASPGLCALEVTVQGLFNGAAVLTVDGQQHFVKVGERSPEGVLLVAADTRKAVVEIDTERHTLRLDRQIKSVFNQPEANPEVSIRRDSNNQYKTRATINGHSLEVLVDTGASSVVVNLEAAERLRIDYRNGTPTKVTTASGVADAFIVHLNTVNVGAITVNHVQGVVVDGSHPPVGLLGMSFLEHVSMREDSGVMYLKSRY